MAVGGYLVQTGGGYYNLRGFRREVKGEDRLINLTASQHTWEVRGTRTGILIWLEERAGWEIRGHAPIPLCVAVRGTPKSVGQELQAAYAGAALGGLPGPMGGGGAGIFTSPGPMTGPAALTSIGVGQATNYANIDPSGALVEGAQLVAGQLLGYLKDERGYSALERAADKLGGDKYRLLITLSGSYSHANAATDSYWKSPKQNLSLEEVRRAALTLSF